jgi:hypothetical protein
MDDAARKQWMEARRSFAPRVPLFLLDWAASTLAMIPKRKITRPQGRPPGYDVVQVESCADIFGSVAKAALYVAAVSFEEKFQNRKNWAEFVGDRDIKALMRRLAEIKKNGEPQRKIGAELQEMIEAHARRLAREVYRRRRRSMPE